MVVFAGDGDAVSIAAANNTSAPLEVLLIGGVPLGEPVARYGPFVMNTKEEIIQAFEDYREAMAFAMYALAILWAIVTRPAPVALSPEVAERA